MEQSRSAFGHHVPRFRGPAGGSVSISRGRVPVGPAAHYVWAASIRHRRSTSIPGLYAAGRSLHRRPLAIAAATRCSRDWSSAPAPLAMRDDDREQWPTESPKFLEFDATAIAAATGDEWRRSCDRARSAVSYVGMSAVSRSEGVTQRWPSRSGLARARRPHLGRRAARRRDVARGQHPHGRTPDRTGRVAARGEPGRPLPRRLPQARRRPLETSRDRNARRLGGVRVIPERAPGRRAPRARSSKSRGFLPAKPAYQTCGVLDTLLEREVPGDQTQARKGRRRARTGD